MIAAFSSKFRYSKDQVASLAMTIAYAVKHGIPVENALNSLLPATPASLFFSLMRYPLAAGLLYPFFRNRANYYYGIRRTIMGLHKGLYLPDCLDMYLGHILPSSYRTGVRMAFESGHQEDLLMKLALTTSQVHTISGVTNYLPIFMTYLSIYLTITSGLFYFIVPRFTRMAMEMCVGIPQPPVLSFITSTPFIWFLSILFQVMVVGICCWLGYRLIAFFLGLTEKNLLGNFLTGLVNDAMALIPFFGRHVKDRLRLDALHRTYGCLVLEKPLIDAVSFAAYSMNNCQLSRQLKRFIDLLHDGVDVNSALEQSKAWDPFTRWIMMAGMQRQALAEAFYLQIQFLHEQTTRSQRFWNKAMAVGFILFIGSLTGVVTIGLFQSLTFLVEQLSNQAM